MLLSFYRDSDLGICSERESVEGTMPQKPDLILILGHRAELTASENMK